MEWHRPERVTIGTRLTSMLLDLFIAGLVAIPPTLFVFLEFLEVWLDGPGTGPPKAVAESFTLYLLPLPMALYLCKDVFNGRSIGKRICKLQVVSLASGRSASALQSTIRNLCSILWPLEVIALFFSPSRRIGDFAAGTEVCLFEPYDRAPKMGWISIILTFLSVYACGILFFWIWLNALEGPLIKPERA